MNNILEGMKFLIDVAYFPGPMQTVITEPYTFKELQDMIIEEHPNEFDYIYV